MGLFGGSKSNSTTSATTQNAGFTETQGAATAIQGSGNTVTTTDYNAVNRAFDFAGQSIGAVEASGRSALNAAVSATEGAVRAVSESAKSESRGLVSDLGMWVVLGIVAVIAARKLL